jgi:uncharacterized protein YkwD
MTRPLATLFLALALALPAPATALADCGIAADIDPSAPGASVPAARDATLCLLNAERGNYGQRALRPNRELARVATAHARDMVQRGYFAHDTPSGPTFVQRILQSNYIPAGAGWSLGENLAWGDGPKATPRQIVAGWMGSPGHRRNILTAGFRDIGIGVVVGAPIAGVNAGATYATDFGAIRRR